MAIKKIEMRVIPARYLIMLEPWTTPEKLMEDIRRLPEGTKYKGCERTADTGTDYLIFEEKEA